MDIKELFKFQLISGSMSGGQNTAGGSPLNGRSLMSDPMGMIWQVLFMIAIGFADEITKLLPVLISTLKEKYVTSFLQKQITDKLDNSPIPISATAVPLEKKHFLNSLSMSRVYVTDSSKNSTNDRAEDMNAMIDAVLEAVARLNNVPSFRLIETAQTMISYRDQPIQLTGDIYLRLDSVSVSAEGQVEKVDLTLCSNSVSAADISRYVRHLHNLRKEELKNALGDTIFFFDQKSKESIPRIGDMNIKDASQMQQAKQMSIKTASKQLAFTKTPFYSNKRFVNIIGDEVRAIEKRVDFFLKRKDWYDAKGVPYQLGLMLSGLPGTGKTSVIRAIANLTGRHIINVNFANITTATQLKNLFFNEKLSVYTDASMCDVQSYLIPVDKRIYVLEEIDAVGDIVKQRTGEATAALPDELTLGEILTVLDGTMESPGRIVVMTSNHPETLDAALIRPGRIDVAVEFGNASLVQIAEMYSSFYEGEMDVTTLPSHVDKRLSPAEVGQVLFRHFDDPSQDKVIADLEATVGKKEITDEKRAASRRPSVVDTPSEVEVESTKEGEPTIKEGRASPARAEVKETGLTQIPAGSLPPPPMQNRPPMQISSVEQGSGDSTWMTDRNTESNKRLMVESFGQWVDASEASNPKSEGIQPHSDLLQKYTLFDHVATSSLYDGKAAEVSLDSYFDAPLTTSYGYGNKDRAKQMSIMDQCKTSEGKYTLPDGHDVRVW